MSAQSTIPARYGEGLAGRPDLPGAALPWLRELRQQSWDRFSRAGLPGQKREAWKYTNLRPLRETDFVPAEMLANGLARDGVPGLLAQPAARFVFVNGYWRADLSDAGGLPKGVRLMSFAQALENGDDTLAPVLETALSREDAPLADLNGALMQDGYVLSLERGARLERPIELVFVRLGDAPVEYHGRHLLLAGENAEARILERHLDLGTGTYFASHALDIVAAQGAHVFRCKLQGEGADAVHMANTNIVLARDARVHNLELTTGAALSRSEIGARLDGKGGELRLDGAYLLRGRQHGDTTTWIEHCAGETTSDEVYKGVLDDRARGVFQGRITVHRDAQGIAGNQLNKTLLLSDKAEIDTKPELEIFADDVKCSHGATAGELDDDALFYMRSRGIPEAEARGLLIGSFVEEALQAVTDEALRGALQSSIDAWLAGVDGVETA